MAKRRSSAPIPVADSSESANTKPKRPRKPRKKSPRQRRNPHQLPPPIPVGSISPEPAPQSEGTQSGLLERVGSLFSSAPKESEKPQSSPAPAFGGSRNSSPEPLPADTAAKLDAIPDVIGDAAAADSPAAPSALDESGIGALMDAVAFEEQDVRDMLEEFFGWMAARFDSEHWALTERQSRILGRPTAQLANSIWAKLRGVIPDILAQWCESTPGATAFLMAAGIVIVPKVMQQVRISRSKPRTVPAQEQPAKGPQSPRTSTPAGPHVPVFAGTVGG